MTHRSSDSIFSECIARMSEANDCETFEVSHDQLNRGSKAVALLRAKGMEFSDDEIFMFATGTESELEDLFCRFPGWEALNDVLNEILNGE